MAKVEIDGKQKELEILVTTKRNNPLLGLDWMKKLGITLETDKTVPQIQQIKEDPDITSLKTNFKKLFTENHTVNGLEVKIQLKEDAKLIQQKGRPVPINLQQSVGKEIEKLIKQGHIEKANNIDENCLVSPVVITVKKDKSIKIALDSRKLNETSVKRKVQMPNMEELISRMSRKIAGGPADEIWIKIRFRLCIRTITTLKRSQKSVHIRCNRGKFNRVLPLPKGFLRFSGYSNGLPGKIDQTLENKRTKDFPPIPYSTENQQFKKKV